MGILTKVRRGKGPVWGSLKRLAGRALHCHLPVPVPAKPFFGLLYCLHVLLRECGIWALRFLWYEPLFRSQCALVGEAFQMEKLPYITGRGQIMIGDRVRLSGKPSFGFSNRLHTGPEIHIGDDTFIGHDCRFIVAGSITIGRNCLLAGGVTVRDCDGHSTDPQRRRRQEPAPPEGLKPVVIGNDVWIGAGAFILKGVTIGDRSIVGAGAVVTRDVPPDAVVAGNPARVVKQLVVEANV